MTWNETLIIILFSYHVGFISNIFNINLIFKEFFRTISIYSFQSPLTVKIWTSSICFLRCIIYSLLWMCHICAYSLFLISSFFMEIWQGYYFNPTNIRSEEFKKVPGSSAIWFISQQASYLNVWFRFTNEAWQLSLCI